MDSNSRTGDILFSGCYTAIITPMIAEGVDYDGLARLVEFQVASGVNGILARTTGGSPTLDWDEHDRIIEKMNRYANGKCRFFV